MKAFELLEACDAPLDLSERARRAAWEIDEAWEELEEPEHRVWLAACTGAPLAHVVEAARLSAERVFAERGDAVEELRRALDLAASSGDSVAIGAAAAACEVISSGGLGSYRRSHMPGFEAFARAAALVARAAEGVLHGEARREARRLDQARQVGALVGAGAQIMLPSSDGPPRLLARAAASDPAQGAFLFAVAASAEATTACVESLGALAPSRDARREIDALVRSTFEKRASQG